MPHRTKHTYHTHLYTFVQKVLVVCPHCEGRAVVRADDFNTPLYTLREVKLVCAGCGHNKTLENVSKRIDPKQKRGQVLIFGAPIDPFFHLPLWLQVEFSGEILWAYNAEHLDFLAAHVGAKLRERNGMPQRARSIGARLPRWMTAAGKREAVLKVIAGLKERI